MQEYLCSVEFDKVTTYEDIHPALEPRDFELLFQELLPGVSPQRGERDHLEPS